MSVSIVRALALLLLCGSAGISAAQSLPSTASGRFGVLDANRDGVVSKYEYDSDTAFSAMDDNHNGRISATELQAILGPQEDGAPSAADRISLSDKNNDGELSDEELRRGVEFRFQWLDANEDGNVDLAELKSGFGIPAVR